jgi:hypothetical protein
VEVRREVVRPLEVRLQAVRQWEASPWRPLLAQKLPRLQFLA